MNKVLLIVFTLTLLVVSFSVMALAGGPNPCPSIPGASPATCATCNASDNGAGDFGACVCKLTQESDPDFFAANFKNMGECVRMVQRDIH